MPDTISEIETADGASISYRLIRKGTSQHLLVLLHGLASNMTRWYEFSGLSSLKEEWDFILIDLRGHGRSNYRGEITLEKWCEDIAAILEIEGYADAVIGGHCLGANIAINFADLHPEKCKGLILLEPIFSQSITGTLKKIRNHIILLSVMIVLIRFFNSLGIFRRKLPFLDLQELDQNARELISAAGTAAVLAKRYGSPIHDLRYIATAAYLQSVRELIRPLPRISGIIAPKLFIFSSGRLFSETKSMEDICSSFENSETVIIESFHWIPTEKPFELQMTIDRWCCKKFKS